MSERWKRSGRTNSARCTPVTTEPGWHIPVWFRWPTAAEMERYEDGTGELPELWDQLWAAWAFAGARCARSVWRELGNQLVTRERTRGAAVRVERCLANATAGGWLPPSAGMTRVTLEFRPRGLWLEIEGIEPEAWDAFIAGWEVAATKLVADRNRRNPAAPLSGRAAAAR